MVSLRTVSPRVNSTKPPITRLLKTKADEGLAAAQVASVASRSSDAQSAGALLAQLAQQNPGDTSEDQQGHLSAGAARLLALHAAAQQQLVLGHETRDQLLANDCVSEQPFHQLNKLPESKSNDSAEFVARSGDVTESLYTQQFTQPVGVEFSSLLSKELRRAGRRVKKLAEKTVELFDRAGKAFRGLVEDATDIVVAVIRRPFEVIKELTSGLHEIASLVVEGNISKAFRKLRDTLIVSGKLSVGLAAEVALMTISALITTVDRLRGAIQERSLTQPEIAQMRVIYGNSIDYKSVTVVTGGTKDQWGMDAHVIGNEIFLPNQDHNNRAVFTDTGSLSSDGLNLLAHEMAHVWQYQHGGTRYISESIGRQIYDGDNDTYAWHHDIKKGREFHQMNPEKQAEIASLIGQAIWLNVVNDRPQQLTLHSLNAVLASLDITLSAEQFAIFERAHESLNPQVAQRYAARVSGPKVQR